MNTVLFAFQIIAAILVLTIAPGCLSQLVRAVVHDRSYTLGRFDLILACSIVLLFVTGLPTGLPTL